MLPTSCSCIILWPLYQTHCLRAIKKSNSPAPYPNSVDGPEFNLDTGSIFSFSSSMPRHSLSTAPHYHKSFQKKDPSVQAQSAAVSFFNGRCWHPRPTLPLQASLAAVSFILKSGDALLLLCLSESSVSLDQPSRWATVHQSQLSLHQGRDVDLVLHI